MPPVVYHSPLLSRIWVAVFGLSWCGYFLGSALYAIYRHLPGDPLAWVMVTLMLTLGGGLSYRTFRLAVLIDGDELVVRNYRRNRCIPRAQIRAFGFGRPTFGRGRDTIVLETTTGRVPLDVFGLYPSATDRLIRFAPTRLRREDALNALLAWSARAAQPETPQPR